MTVAQSRHPGVELSKRAAALEDAPISWLMAEALQRPGLLSLAAGFVDLSSFPAAEIGQLAQGLLSQPASAAKAFQYGTTQGEPELRQCLYERLAAGSAAPIWREVSAEDIVVTSGSQQLLYLLGESLLDPGDIVLVENPSYFVYVGALQSFGCRIVGIDADGRGMRPDVLNQKLGELAREGVLERVKMLYIMTYSQNPTGATLSADRRPQLWQTLEDWSTRGLNAVTVEDAAYRGVRFPHIEDIPPLFEQQGACERVCYLESFSKTLSPGIRLGFGILPPALRQAVLALKSQHDFGTSNLTQQLMLAILQQGVFDRYLDVIRARYADKCDALLGLLRRELGTAIDFVEPTGGLYIWMTLRDDVDTGRASVLFRRALEERVLYVPGEICAPPGTPPGAVNRSMRLCYSYPDEDELLEAGRRLVRAVRSVVA